MTCPASSATPRAVRVRAHAKINLNLRVLTTRADGYHDLRTVFQAIALHDTLTLVPCPGPLALESSRSGVPLDSTNLVWRAADLLWQHLCRPGRPHDVTARLEKRIPMKAGLGGGSSDAAAALLGFARLWEPDLPAAELVELGKRLGADVPFFFTGGAALGLGRGDELYPLPDLPRLGVLLVMPGFDVSTADAYRWIDDARMGQGAETSERHTTPDVDSCSLPVLAPTWPARYAIPRCAWREPDDEIANDFQPVVAARYPAITDIVHLLESNGASAAAMTGSGSAVFGLFEDDAALRAAARSATRSGHSIEKTRTLARREYLRASTPVVPRG